MQVKNTTLALNTAVQKTYHFRASWLQLARPLTLTGTISPIIVGTIFAAQSGSIRFDIFIAMLGASLFIQAATNMFNDYFDFRNGQDQEKWVLSEGTRTPHGPSIHMIPTVAGAMLAAAVGIGAWLASQSNLWIILVGIVGIIAGYAYSAGPHSLSSVGLGETVAAIFLGVVPATLAYIVQGHALNVEIIAVSIPFALLISTMILTNNIRDIEKDRTFRNTIVMRMGRRKSVYLLTVLLGLAYFSLLTLIFFDIIPWNSVAVVFALPIAFRLRWTFRIGAKRVEEIGCMKWVAWHHWAFSFLFIAGLLIGF